MLISYVLDGGTAAGHGIDALADKWLGHEVIQFKDLTGSGRSLDRRSTWRHRTGPQLTPPKTPTSFSGSGKC